MSLFLLNPIMLWTAALGAAIAAIHLLLPRWRRRVVPSLIVWRRVVARGIGLSARRFSTDIVLLLAILASVCLVLAAADPRTVTRRDQSIELIVVLDNGTAMSSAAAGGRTRLEDARRAAEKALLALPSGARASVVATSPSARVVAALGSVARASEALASVRTVEVTGDLAEAIALAGSIGSDRADTLVVTSRQLPVSSTRVRRIGVGSESRNIAFVRADFSATQAFCALRNYGSQGITTRVTLRQVAPSPVREIVRREVSVPAGGRVDVVLSLPGGSAPGSAEVVELGHSYDADDVEVDDRVVAARLPGIARKVGVVGDLGSDLGSALWAARAEVVRFTQPPGEEDLRELDLLVYVGETPRSWPPAVSSVMVRPTKSIGPLKFLGDELRDVEASFGGGEEARSPVRQFPAEEIVNVASAEHVRIFAEHESLLAGDGEVLGARLRQSGREHIYLGFSPGDSDWPDRSSFPVFVARVLENAGSRQGDEAELGFVEVGKVPVVVVPIRAASLISPGGKEVASGNRLLESGLYRPQSGSGESGALPLAANLVSARESDNRLPRVATREAVASRSAAATRRYDTTMLAGLLSVIAMILCATEWMVGARRD